MTAYEFVYRKETNPFVLSENDKLAMSALESAGFIIMFDQDIREHFFVGAGSHGGSGHTLRRAIKRCLACCDIHKFWRTNQGELAIDFCKRLCEQHLGGWK